MKNFLCYLVILLFALTFSCKPEECKNLNRDNIFGRWKLVEVSINKNDDPNNEIIDYTKDNIIYHFQANNTLVIIGSIIDTLTLFNVFTEGERYYEYRKMACTGDPGPSLIIDNYLLASPKKWYWCTALLNNDSMSIANVDPVKIMINENGSADYYNWSKTFVVLK